MSSFVARNLGLHLLVASGQTDVVAICLHALDLRDADRSHAILEQDGVPCVMPEPPLQRPGRYREADRRLRYQLAQAIYGNHPHKIAAQLGVTPKTLRAWRRAGKV